MIRTQAHPRWSRWPRAAGVSRATAGRVLAGSPRVSEAARAAVLAAASELSYVHQPRPRARSSPAAATPSRSWCREPEERVFADPFFPAVLQGRPQGRWPTTTCSWCSSCCRPTPSTTSSSASPPAATSTGRCSSPCTATTRCPRGCARSASRWCSRAGRFRSDDDVPVRRRRQPRGARGSRPGPWWTPAARGSPPSPGPSTCRRAQDRLEGFTAGAARGRAPTAASRTATGDFSTEGGYRAMKPFCGNACTLDGVFVANDQMAPGRAARAARRRARRARATSRSSASTTARIATGRLPAPDDRAPAHGAAGPRDGPGAHGAGRTASRSTRRWCCPPSSSRRDTC